MAVSISRLGVWASGPKVESEFVNAPIRHRQQREFKLDDRGYKGPNIFYELVIGLLRDWGTSLTLSLYQAALITLLGGKAQIEVMLPICRNGVYLGNQRFCLADSNSAFKLTALNHGTGAYEHQLLRLIQFSPLKIIHWVNIEHEFVGIQSVSG